MVIRFNSNVVNDTALAMTIFEECMELLEEIQSSEEPAREKEAELYAKAADIFEGITGLPLPQSIESISWPWGTPGEITEFERRSKAAGKHLEVGSDGDECHLGQPPFPNQCCCICANHLEDRSHPHTDGGRVTSRRGWVCVVDGICMSGWPEHSAGCESFMRKETGDDTAVREDQRQEAR